VTALQDPAADADEGAGERLLEVVDLKTHFRTPRGVARAVDGVSFTLDRGRTIGVVGESGSGKSVLARSIMGLLPKSNVVREGTIRFEGVDLMDVGSKEMQKYWGSQISMVFQDPMTSLNPVMKIGKQITEALRTHLDVDREFAKETAASLLRQVGIPEPERRLNEYPHQLSGGMRQRVMIAIALSCGPKLIFADEPTTALDVTVQAQILDLLEEQQRDRFMAMVLITHDLGVVAGRADEIAVMYAGKIVERAPTRTLFSEMRHPYTEALLESIPKLQLPSHTRLAAIAGRPPDIVHPPVGCNFAARCPYAQSRCLEEEPPLAESVDTEAGHQFACFYPVGTPQGIDALARNRAAGSTAAQRSREEYGDAGGVEEAERPDGGYPAGQRSREEYGDAGGVEEAERPDGGYPAGQRSREE
jgi:peptide/nickel transport system ATP-binding protein